MRVDLVPDHGALQGASQSLPLQRALHDVFLRSALYRPQRHGLALEPRQEHHRKVGAWVRMACRPSKPWLSGRDQVEEHKIDVPARRPVQTGQQGFGPMDLKSTRIRKRYFDQFGIAGIVFDE